MRVAVSSDEYTPLIDALLEEVKKKGHTVIYFGPFKGGPSKDWPDVTLQAIQCLNDNRADEAIVVCWTGTGCTLVANKVAGVRAALCTDRETAQGARIWNHANVLGLSLRLTSEPLLKEILDGWFETPFSNDGWNLSQIEKIRELEK